MEEKIFILLTEMNSNILVMKKEIQEIKAEQYQMKESIRILNINIAKILEVQNDMNRQLIQGNGRNCIKVL